MRRLAYQYATQEKCIVPLSWSVKKEAGRDWLSGFLRRHQDLSIRKPQATSLSRAISLNKHNVDSFFDNVDVIRSRGIPPSRWFNALQYLPQERLFHHIFSMVPLLVLLDERISLAGCQTKISFCS